MIALKTKRFLDFAWGYKEKLVLDKIKDEDLLLQLKEQASKFPSVYRLRESNTLVEVWRTNEFLMDAKRQEELRRQSEARVARSNSRTELLKKLRYCISQQTGLTEGESLLDEMFASVMQKREPMIMELYGLSSREAELLLKLTEK